MVANTAEYENHVNAQRAFGTASKISQILLVKTFRKFVLNPFEKQQVSNRRFSKVVSTQLGDLCQPVGRKDCK